MRLIFSLTFFLFSILISDEHNLLPQESLASTEGLANTIVGGHVCVATGDFVDNEIDFHLIDE